MPGLLVIQIHIQAMCYVLRWECFEKNLIVWMCYVCPNANSAELINFRDWAALT